MRIERVGRTGSTNTDLLERVRAWPPAAAFEPVLRVAELQVAGRGRQGRGWQATSGASLTFSIAWPLDRSDLAGLSLAVGVVVAEALDGAAAEPRIGLKWPNDLLLAGPDLGRKLGGILIETVPLGTARVAIVGIGVNVRPVEGATARGGIACWEEIEAGADVERALQAIAAPLADALALFDREGFAAFAARFAARDLLQGREVSSAAGTAALLRGRACGVSARGELIVRGPGGDRLVSSGEVQLVSLAETAEASAPC